MLVIGNTAEATRLGGRLGCRVAVLKTEVFPDGEVSMRLSGDEIEEQVLVYFQFVWPGSLDAQILQLTALLQYLEGANIRLVMPYFPYARSLPWRGEGVVASAAPLLSIIKEKVKELWTVDLHCDESVLQPYVGQVHILEISLRPTIAKYLQDKFTEAVLVAPDEGAENRVRHLAELGGWSYLVMKKQRRSATEVSVEMVNIISDANKVHVIVDDIISTGRTFMAAVDCLRRQGVTQVAGVITHNVAQPEVLQSLAADGVMVFTSNSVARSSFDFDVLESVAAMTQKEIRLSVK